MYRTLLATCGSEEMIPIIYMVYIMRTNSLLTHEQRATHCITFGPKLIPQSLSSIPVTEIATVSRPRSDRFAGEKRWRY